MTDFEEPTAPATPASTEHLDLAVPELFQRNVFRITGLPVDASPTAVRRRRDEWRMEDRLHAGSPPSTIASSRAPLPQPPDSGTIRDAFDTLATNPRRRLHDELFWFWASTTSGTETAATSIERRHDEAVAAHLRALDLELQAQDTPLTSMHVDCCDAAWRSALRAWFDVLDEPELWQRMRRRVAEIDDPRLTTGVVRRMRETAAVQILLTSARTVLHAGSYETARRHHALLASCPFPRETVDRALQISINPTLADIDRDIDHVFDRINQARHAEEVREALCPLDADVLPRVRRVQRVLGAENDTVRTTRDDLARAMTQAAIVIHNLAGRGENPTTLEAAEEALDILRTALKHAHRDETRTRITETKGVIADNIACLTAGGAPRTASPASTVDGGPPVACTFEDLGLWFGGGMGTAAAVVMALAADGILGGVLPGGILGVFVVAVLGYFISGIPTFYIADRLDAFVTVRAGQTIRSAAFGALFSLVSTLAVWGAVELFGDGSPTVFGTIVLLATTLGGIGGWRWAVDHRQGYPEGTGR